MDAAISTGADSDLIEGSFITHDGLSMSTYRLPRQRGEFEPVILLHGLSDHSRSLPYLRLGRFLAARGFEVFGFDRRGSGRSGGLASYTATWDDLRSDLSRFVDIVEDQCGKLPSLVGLSLGGLQALDFALTSPESVHTCIALAPALDASSTTSWLRRIIPILARWWPTLAVDPGLDDGALARDPEMLRTYRADPLWRLTTTPALAHAALVAIERIHRRAEHIRTPLFLIHGTADRIVPISGTRSVFQRLGSTDKTFIEIPGAYHALPIEPEGDQVAGQIADWLTARRSQVHEVPA